MGVTDAGDRSFRSASTLLGWLCEQIDEADVFLKDATDHRYPEVLADRRFLSEARHAFLIRRPEEIAASYFALYPEMSIDEVGVEWLYELYVAVREVSGARPPIVIDSDDLTGRPEATMAAYCSAVGLPFDSAALAWEAGERSEWQRSARWHSDVSASRGFERRTRAYPHTVENSERLARFAAHHLPFYERLRADRIRIPD